MPGSRSRAHRIAGALAAGIAIAILASPATAAPPDGCATGAKVVDELGRPGQIIAGQDGLCLVKSSDGRTQSWIPRESLHPAPASDREAPPADAEPAEPTLEDAYLLLVGAPSKAEAVAA